MRLVASRGICPQVLRLDLAVHGQDGGPLQAILEFADVAGPVVAEQEFEGHGAEAAGGLVVLGGDLGQGVGGQQGEVLAVVAQGGSSMVTPQRR